MANETTSAKQRTYRKRVRAEQEEATRERITEATVTLHGSVGPARSTVSAIAREAGVQRATVYRHFPSEESLFQACTAHYWARNPLPDVESWKSIRDPGERLRVSIAEFYDFFEHNEEMLDKTSRDSHLVPAMDGPRAAFMAFVDHATAVLVTGRQERGGARRRVAAAIGHVLFFPTWQSLARMQGLSNPEAVAVAVAMVEGAGPARPSRTRPA
jgi:AcrR family transcriptional regulator